MTNSLCVSLDWTADEPQPLLNISTGMVATNEIPSWIKQINANGSKHMIKVVQIIKCTCTVFIDNFRNISTNSSV